MMRRFIDHCWNKQTNKISEKMKLMSAFCIYTNSVNCAIAPTQAEWNVQQRNTTEEKRRS